MNAVLIGGEAHGTTLNTPEEETIETVQWRPPGEVEGVIYQRQPAYDRYYPDGGVAVYAVEAVQEFQMEQIIDDIMIQQARFPDMLVQSIVDRMLRERDILSITHPALSQGIIFKAKRSPTREVPFDTWVVRLTWLIEHFELPAVEA